MKVGQEQGASVAWYRTPIERETLKSLSRKSDWAGALHVLAHVLLLIGTGTATYYLLEHQYLALGIFFLMLHGTFYSFLGWAGAGHELNHHTVFASRGLNRLFLWLFSFLTWNNPVFFRASHARHHRSTVYSGVDFEVRLPQQVNHKNWIFALTFDFPALYRALTIAFDNSRGIIRGEGGNQLFPQSDTQARCKLFWWARFLLFGHLMLTTTFIAMGEWTLLLLVTFAPFTCTWLNKLLAQAQHIGMQPNVPDFRRNSRTVLLNPFLAFLYWQMNFHIEHHMYPSVPFFRLKTLRTKIAHDLPKPEYGLVGMLRNVIMRQNPGSDWQAGDQPQ